MPLHVSLKLSRSLSLSLNITEFLHLPCLWVSPLIKSIRNTLGVWQSWLRGEDQRRSTGCLPKHRENYSHPSASTGFPSGSAVKNPPAILETQKMLVRSLGRVVPLEEGMAAHSSILAWRIPLIEEPGRLQSVGLQRVGHDWVTEHGYMQDVNYRRNWMGFMGILCTIFANFL